MSFRLYVLFMCFTASVHCLEIPVLISIACGIVSLCQIINHVTKVQRCRHIVFRLIFVALTRIYIYCHTAKRFCSFICATSK